ncbi:hypothetical protein HII36_26590 [Nonomuraea sp. NN258]|uniref:hypothetical protein n=1 Tax=Nonomuraea antri TaxID=2730852 RepID=UPI0015698312|nr:hypothetical protein [Nonomuraea antri]NRQ35369.1 hypothetical protein [Nonomuraea antri]
MPTQEHEFLIELFRERPSLAATLLAETGVAVPPFAEARLHANDLNECEPTEYRADGVVLLADERHQPVAGVVVEVQRKYKKEKTWSWPSYLANLRARLKCPGMLLVVCPDPHEAAKCAQPIDMGHPGWTLRPLVIGPDLVPLVTEVDRAIAEPELAALSAIAHGAGEEGVKVFQALHDALPHLPEEQGRRYSDLVLAVLPKVAAEKFLEIKMATGIYEYKSEYVRRWIAKGQAEGEAKALLRILENRGIPVSDDALTRITECTDEAVLTSWIDKVIEIDSVDELFE